MVDIQLTLKLHFHVIVVTTEMDVTEQPVEQLDNGVTTLQHVTKVTLNNLYTKHI